jgi:hypothetical protein
LAVFSHFGLFLGGATRVSECPATKIGFLCSCVRRGQSYKIFKRLFEQV